MSLLIKTDSECDFEPIEFSSDSVSLFAVYRKERASEQDMQGLSRRFRTIKQKSTSLKPRVNHWSKQIQ